MRVGRAWKKRKQSGRTTYFGRFSCSLIDNQKFFFLREFGGFCADSWIIDLEWMNDERQLA